MPLKDLFKTPWPWFGGKADAAPAVWEALGDVAHYVEPFAGSLAVLLRRPHPCNRTYYSETVNDLDGLLCNAWRSITYSPDATAEAASWPVCEADLHARHLALLKWREERNLQLLMADPEWHDPKMAGWWMWGQSAWIGSGWCSGSGAWVVGTDGRIFKRPREAKRTEPGVHVQLPHIGNDGQGINHAGTREPGVHVKRPHLGNNGQGINRPVTREPGVSARLPHISDNGRGISHAGTREPGVSECDDATEYHPMTMPELRRWMQYLSARLRHVRILNGDWTRACTSGALKSLAVRQGDGVAGVFLDPPYGDVRDANIYAHDSLTVADEVRAWCIANGDDPKYRIVLAGFDSEHTELEARGWRVVEWFRRGFLKGGMANTAGDSTKTQQHRERLWLSPHCLTADTPPPAPKRTRARKQANLFGDDQ
jgi:site-specific DNA-adenine methylase